MGPKFFLAQKYSLISGQQAQSRCDNFRQWRTKRLIEHTVIHFQ